MASSWKCPEVPEFRRRVGSPPLFPRRQPRRLACLALLGLIFSLVLMFWGRWRFSNRAGVLLLHSSTSSGFALCCCFQHGSLLLSNLSVVSIVASVDWGSEWCELVCGGCGCDCGDDSGAASESLGASIQRITPSALFISNLASYLSGGSEFIKTTREAVNLILCA